MVSKFQKVVNFLYRRFVQEMGREPATAKEIMDIQNEAVRYFNKTKGAPLTSKKPAFQGFTPKVIEGGKKEGIAAIENINNQFKKALEKRKEMFPGSTDKTLFKDSPKAIAKIKADNKAAIKRLKKKKTDDPENMADGGEVENNVKLASSYSEDWDKWGYQDFKKYESDGGTKSWKDWYNDIYIPMLDKQFGTDFASGGRAGRGLNYLLGEDDQNVRMPSGGLPGLLGE